ncbi:hypothetical protein BCV70DRAFT_197083 [Testicularia cyperi]|uniref:Uncharacterized protein n=1 Tax=Testicularia cyperi TaxID=1882483 RepID=A0A317XX01_9BASI|nr:hypothetical protein BCV70DRAFT_197083 [Testicularia cyperi]
MSGRQGGKAKPLKAPKKQNKELDEDVSVARLYGAKPGLAEIGSRRILGLGLHVPLLVAILFLFQSFPLLSSSSIAIAIASR